MRVRRRREAARSGVESVHVAEGERLRLRSRRDRPRAGRARGADRPSAVLASGHHRGNEVLAHVAAITDLPLAANCVAARGDPSRDAGALGRQPARGGAAARRPAAPDRAAARGRGGAGDGEPAAVERFTPELADEDLVVHVRERVGAATGGVSLAEAKVVVSCGRGVGLARGLRDHRGARRAARRRRRLLARGHHGGLATAHGPGRPDRDEDRARHLHRVRHLRRDAAHGGLQGGEGDPRDQHGSRGADPRERRLRGDRRPARGRPGDLGRAEKGAGA